MSQINRGAWPLVTLLLESAHWSWIDETSLNRYHLQMEQSIILDTFYLTNDSFLARWQWSTASNRGTKMNVVLLKKILSQKWTNLTWYYKIPANVKLVTVTFPGSILFFIMIFQQIMKICHLEDFHFEWFKLSNKTVEFCISKRWCSTI